MTKLVKAELMAAVSSRPLWWLALGALIFNVGGVFLAVLPGSEGLSTSDITRNAYQMAAMGYLFTMLMGAVGTAGAYRRQTVTEAFLIEPRRGRVVAVKLVSAAIVGLVVALAGAVATTATAIPVLSANGYPSYTDGVPTVLLGAIAGTALYTVLGAALGAVIRHAAATVIVVVVWFFYAEYLLLAYVDGVGKWLPGGAAKAFSSWAAPNLDLLPAWSGGLLFAFYVAVLAVLATSLTKSRDVT